MNEAPRFQGTANYIYAYWPQYTAVYSTLIAAFFFMGVSADQGWLGFIPLTLAAIILIAYFLIAHTWLAHQQLDEGELEPHLALFKMGELTPEGELVYIHLGLRKRPLSLVQQISTGHLTVIDVYSPNTTPSRALIRWRNRTPQPPPDRRLTWQTGSVTILPFPNGSVQTVVICQMLDEIAQRGDQLALLKEVKRVLKTDGRLLIAETIRNQNLWIAQGPLALTTPTANYWRKLLDETSFFVLEEKTLGGVIRCFTTGNFPPRQSQQLAFDLGENT